MVETTELKDGGCLDTDKARAHGDALRVTERFRRTDVGQMELTTIDAQRILRQPREDYGTPAHAASTAGAAESGAIVVSLGDSMTQVVKPAVVSLHERSGTVLVTIHDCIGAHVCERLNRERRIEAAHRWEGRATQNK